MRTIVKKIKSDSQIWNQFYGSQIEQWRVKKINKGALIFFFILFSALHYKYTYNVRFFILSYVLESPECYICLKWLNHF